MKNLDQMYRQRGGKVLVWLMISFLSLSFQISTIKDDGVNWWHYPLAVTVWIFAVLAGGLIGFHVTDDYRQRTNRDPEV